MAPVNWMPNGMVFKDWHFHILWWDHLDFSFFMCHFRNGDYQSNATGDSIHKFIIPNLIWMQWIFSKCFVPFVACLWNYFSEADKEWRSVNLWEAIVLLDALGVPSIHIITIQANWLLTDRHTPDFWISCTVCQGPVPNDVLHAWNHK